MITDTYLSIIQTVSYYGDAFGRTPFYIAKEGVKMVSFFAWGFRLGAPFYQHFTQLTLRLEAGGILELWLQQVINKRIKDNRVKFEEDGDRPLWKSNEVSKITAS